MNEALSRTHPGAGAIASQMAWRPVLSMEGLALCASLFFSVFGNASFWRAVIATGDLHGATGLLSGASLFVLVTALHLILLLAVLWSRAARPVLAVLLLTSAVAAYFMGRYTIYLDSDMVSNVLHTDMRESFELLSPALLPSLLVFAVLPAIALWQVQLKRRSWPRTLAMRSVWLLAAVAVAAGSALLAFQDLSSLMRNHRELRHLITPGNYLVSLAVVLTDHGRKPAIRRPIGRDAYVAARPAHARPRVLVLVIGETLRAQNWGLNGYVRQTTPGLARIDPVNFTDVAACGTSTEVSLPCMFSPGGRVNYDKSRVAASESLLHVLDHAGIAVQWRDNQSGCKGVCTGLPTVAYQRSKGAHGCEGESCLDEVMLAGLAAEIARQPGDLIVVLHQLGNHGPAYHLRYPARLRRYAPTCDSDDLGDCSREEIVNSYDNAVLYTDEFLARTIRLLSAQSGHDAALIYLSDHGESLGEGRLYLHGLPYAIAPRTQTQVPMAVWLSPELSAARGIDVACLRARATRPASHDNLFHSVLGLMQVQTQAYLPQLDVFAECDDGKRPKRLPGAPSERATAAPRV